MCHDEQRSRLRRSLELLLDEFRKSLLHLGLTFSTRSSEIVRIPVNGSIHFRRVTFATWLALWRVILGQGMRAPPTPPGSSLRANLAAQALRGGPPWISLQFRRRVQRLSSRRWVWALGPGFQRAATYSALGPDAPPLR
eukprot:CAMPEP_0175848448 /NCGR_PEP_ID=MMETSP0107_2-20121207/23939_1 /TAXON_ID=195067 ORGANISM="Goniomonas pacifica, Strain CCMP1869" /NCGR_SAMPLE_ID=MMETSP0107_2 /ASSEMBLY_ACC=CAM_ASM_000203 /LENGTH=138 /DNA_ID=CAMNT_0017163425 /DNA_START=250 /DNA_END=666 /DNA_ORIENTATION=+